MRSAPTIKDVAREAGVSVATVSNVINNRSSTFRETTRRRVTRAIEKLSYRPQASGRGLRTAAKHVLALIVVDESDNYLLDPFVANVVVGYTQCCNERGYLAVLHGCTSHNLDQMVVMKQISVDGHTLLLSGGWRQRQKSIDYVMGLQHPVVLLQEIETPPAGDICVVRQDDVDGGRQICEHLLARGCKRLLLVIPKLEWPALEARLRGIRDAIKRSKRTVVIDTLVSQSEGFEDVSNSIKEHMSKGKMPDAIISANDQVATAILNVLRRLKVPVPGGVLLTGFNAFESWRHTSPTITTVTSPARELGFKAAAALIDRVEQGEFAKREIVLPIHLRQGEST